MGPKAKKQEKVVEPNIFGEVAKERGSIRSFTYKVTQSRIEEWVGFGRFVVLRVQTVKLTSQQPIWFEPWRDDELYSVRSRLLLNQISWWRVFFADFSWNLREEQKDILMVHFLHWSGLSFVGQFFRRRLLRTVNEVDRCSASYMNYLRDQKAR